MGPVLRWSGSARRVHGRRRDLTGTERELQGRQRVLWLLIGLGALAAWVILFAWVPPTGAEHSICLFRRITGISCPGCGLTRSMAHLAKGHLSAGLRMHPMAPVLVVEAALLWLAWGARLLRNKSLTAGAWATRLALAHAVAFILLWIGRLVSGTLPPGS